MTTVRLRALGVDLDLDLPEDVPGLHDQVLQAWSRCLVPLDHSSAPVLCLRIGPDEGDLASLLAAPENRRPGHEVTAPDPSMLMERLSQHVTYEAIAAQAGRLVMLHACAVADPASGHCIAFVGPSGLGKTTLARRWGRDWGYVTDETVAIGAELEVLAYPKPLSIRGDGVKQQTGPDELGLGWLPNRDLSLRAVVLLDRDDAYAATPVVEEVATVEAVAHLAQQSSFLTRLDSPLARLAEVATAHGPALGVRYRDCEDLGALIHELIGGGQ